MKCKVHLRVAYNKHNRRHQVTANVRPSNEPLTTGRGEALPTVAFGVLLDIPDKMFSAAEQVIAELTIKEKDAAIAAEVIER